MAQRDYIKLLQTGKIKIKELEQHVSDREAMDIRLEYIADKIKHDISDLGDPQFEPRKIRNRNIENLIGAVELPLGVAGPIKVNGRYAKGRYFVPLATTEGTLVASASRGAKAITLAGGADVILTNPGIARAPIFRVNSIKDVRKVISWIERNFDLLKQTAKKESGYIDLLEITPYSLGKDLWLRMSFDTQEAMGMNMATKTSKTLATMIAKKIRGVSLMAVSGNLCNDKKANFLNMILGRGRKLQAEVTLPRKIVKEVFKVTPEKMVELNQSKVWRGGVLSGSLSFNAHFANIIAAVFAATGQDLAHVVNSSQGYIILEMDGKDLYAALSLPSILVGNVGGGTGLPDQASAQRLILTNIDSPRAALKDKAHTLAEVLAASVLAGDLSLHAALASGALVTAHEQFGRGKSQ